MCWKWSRKAADSFAWKSICSVLEIFKCGINSAGADLVSLKWLRGATGEYTVKEGYHLAYKWKLAHSVCNGNGETSDAFQIQQFWKNVWRLKVPERVKIHIWKLFHHALSVLSKN